MFYDTRFKVIFSVSKHMSTLICVYAYHTSDIIKINKYLVLLFKQQNHAYVTIIIIYQIFFNCTILHVEGMFLSSGKIKKFPWKLRGNIIKKRNTVKKHPKVK